MRRQSQALRLAIKQATNAKPVSQTNKPQKIIVQANITQQRCCVEIERFLFQYESSCCRYDQKTVGANDAAPRPIASEEGRAAVFRRYPFTIILKREIVNSSTPDLRLKLDPGSNRSGVAIVNQQTGEVVFAAEIEHRGHAIKASLDARRRLRRGRRQRKTRYRKPRFDNRARPEGSLPPSLESRVENVYTWAHRLQRVYPLKGVAFELVKFDMQMMQNPEIEGVEYQQGELRGYELREYVLIKFDHACVYAGPASPCDEVLNVDHLVPRSRGGSNRASNLVCACRKHNEEKGARSLEEYSKLRGVDFAPIKAQAKAPLKDAAAVNATRWALFNRLKALDLPIETGSGGLTKFNRTKRGLPKAHWVDAACVGSSTPENLKIENVQAVQIKATGHGSRRMCRTDKHGFPKAHRTRKTMFMGFQTGDIVKAEIPKGKFAGRHVGRLSAVRERPSFTLNGFDVHPRHLKRF